MSRTMRILFLSAVLAVLAVSSAFAYVDDDIDIDLDDQYYDEDTELLTTLTTEGYTYTNKLVLTGEGLETTARTYTLSDMNIDWDVYDSDGKDISWLQLYMASDDQVLIMEGEIPAYNTEASYNIKVIATASVTIVSVLHELSDDTTVTIGVGQDTYTKLSPSESKKDLMPYFSFDVTSPYKVSEGYEVHLIIPEEDGYLKYYIPADLVLNDNISLPLWLSFDVEATKTIDNTSYPTDIRFFYVSPDYAMSEDVSLSVHIMNVNELDSTTLEIGDDDNIDITWNVAYSATDEEDTSISLASSDVSFDISYGGSDSATTTYTGSAPTSWAISTGSKSTIASKDLGLAITSDDKKGTITLAVAPKAAGYYTGTITFTASDDSTATLALTVSIEPKLTISEDKFTLTADFDTDSSNIINYTNGTSSSKLTGWTASPSVPASFDIDISSDDSTITVKMHPTISGDYSGTFTFTDSYGSTASIPVELHALPKKTSPNGDPNTDPNKDPGGPATPPFTITNPERTLPITAGGTITANFVSNNGSGNVTWTRNVTAGTGVELSFSATTGARTIATITASDTATDSTIVITATDGQSRTTTATLTITVTRNEIPNNNNNGESGNNGNNGSNGNGNGNNGNSNSNGGIEETVMDVDPLEFVTNTTTALGRYGVVYDETPEAVATGDRDLSGVSSALPDYAVSVLPVMQSDKTGIFTFNVNNYLVGAVVGEVLNVYVQQVTLGGGNVSSAEAVSAVLVDGSGNRIYYFPEDGVVNMAVYMEEGQSYASAITHAVEGTGPGDPKGGCSAAGLNAFALMFAAPLFFRKRK